MYNEIRFKALKYSNPDRALKFLEQARQDAARRYNMYKHLADMGA